MLVARSRNGVPVRLTEERWRHIVLRHPEMENQSQRILEAVEQPDKIQLGDFGELLALRFYAETPLTSKFLVVAYREVTPDNGFIVTAYLARQVSEKRTTLWRR